MPTGKKICCSSRRRSSKAPASTAYAISLTGAVLRSLAKSFESIIHSPLLLMGFGSGLIFVAYRLVDFLAEHPHFAGGVDPNAYLVAVDAHYGNNDFVTDGEAFAGTAAEYQHRLRLTEK